jgi:hypothetical protein
MEQAGVTSVVALLDRLPQELVAGEVAVAEVELHLEHPISDTVLFRRIARENEEEKKKLCSWGNKAGSRTWRRTFFALPSSSGAAVGAAMDYCWSPIAIELDCWRRDWRGIAARV